MPLFLKDAIGAGFTPVSSTNPVPVSLSASGGVTTLANGTTAAPSLVWANNTTTGFYSPGSARVTFASGGTDYWDFNGSTLAGANSASISVPSGGTLTVSGVLTGAVQALSGAGAVNVTQLHTDFTSTGGAQALTLANGVAGQLKTIVHVVDGGSGVLTPTTKVGFSTITFTNAGDSCTLRYSSAGWAVVGISGAALA